MTERKEWQQNEGTFSLRNNKKKNEKAPDLAGQLRINGELYDLSAWQKTTAGGGTWWSGTVKTAWKPAASNHPVRETDDRRDEIPW
jgi:hypothetical protein